MRLFVVEGDVARESSRFACSDDTKGVLKSEFAGEGERTQRAECFVEKTFRMTTAGSRSAQNERMEMSKKR